MNGTYPLVLPTWIWAHPFCVEMSETFVFTLSVWIVFALELADTFNWVDSSVLYGDDDASTFAIVNVTSVMMKTMNHFLYI